MVAFAAKIAGLKSALHRFSLKLVGVVDGRSLCPATKGGNATECAHHCQERVCCSGLWITSGNRYRLGLPASSFAFIWRIAEVPGSLWDRCVQRLESDLPEQHFNTWIRPLQAVQEEQTLRLLAPNRFVVDWVREHFYEQISAVVSRCAENREFDLVIEVGTRRPIPVAQPVDIPEAPQAPARQFRAPPGVAVGGRLNPDFTFKNFVSINVNNIKIVIKKSSFWGCI